MKRDVLVKLGYAALKAGIRPPEVPLIRRFYEQGYLRDLLKKLRINCVLDVGANVGNFSKNLRMIGYKGLMFSFDPIEEEFAFMSRLAEGDALWQTFNFALGNENTTKHFNVIEFGDRVTVLSSFLSPKGNQGVTRKASVEVRRLDSILDDLLLRVTDPRIFLKVDTQGYDLER
ncbi:MAG: FkbM family methyltransferase [Nitrososphaera sp.]|nr:FkbM family methyltransferase [Nitrososphaera sp.]